MDLIWEFWLAKYIKGLFDYEDKSVWKQTKTKIKCYQTNLKNFKVNHKISRINWDFKKNPKRNPQNQIKNYQPTFQLKNTKTPKNSPKKLH